MDTKSLNPYESPQSRELATVEELNPPRLWFALFFYEFVVISVALILLCFNSQRYSDLQAWLIIAGTAAVLSVPISIFGYYKVSIRSWKIMLSLFIYSAIAISFLTFIGGWLRH
jgi:hypothetical protein